MQRRQSLLILLYIRLIMSKAWKHRQRVDLLILPKSPVLEYMYVLPATPSLPSSCCLLLCFVIVSCVISSPGDEPPSPFVPVLQLCIIFSSNFINSSSPFHSSYFPLCTFLLFQFQSILSWVHHICFCFSFCIGFVALL